MAVLQNVSEVHMTVAAAILKGKFLKLGNAGIVAATAAAGDDAVGVSLEDRSSAQVTAGDVLVPMALPGCKCKILAGAAIDISAAVIPVTSDSAGRAVAVAAATDRILGYALQSATAADQVIEILFVKGADRRDA